MTQEEREEAHEEARRRFWSKPYDWGTDSRGGAVTECDDEPEDEE